MSTDMAREGAGKALATYDLHEKAIRKAEAAARTNESMGANKWRKVAIANSLRVTWIAITTIFLQSLSKQFPAKSIDSKQRRIQQCFTGKPSRNEAPKCSPGCRVIRFP